MTLNSALLKESTLEILWSILRVLAVVTFDVIYLLSNFDNVTVIVMLILDTIKHRVCIAVYCPRPN